MSRHDPIVALRHMLDHAREAAAMVEGRTRAELDGGRRLSLALTRLLEIIGAAAGCVTDASGGRGRGRSGWGRGRCSRCWLRG